MFSNAGKQAPASTEGSALISLGELFKLEERRVEEEQRARHRQHEQDRHAREERIAQQRAELEAKKAEAERERSERDKAEAEDAARLAGAMLGFISRAQIEAEAAATERARRAEHSRELELERLRQASSAQGLRRIAAAVAAVGLLAVGTLLGAYFGVIAPQNERMESALRNEADAKSDEVHALRQKVDDSRRSESAQAARLAAAEKERDRYRDETVELRAALQQTGKKSAATPASTAARPPATTVAEQRCQYEGDPMCPYIQR